MRYELLCDGCASAELEARCDGDQRSMLYEAERWQRLWGWRRCEACDLWFADWAVPLDS